MTAHKSRGFGATTAIVLLSLGTIAMSAASLGSSISHADAIDKRERRIQAELNMRACDDSALLIKAKDKFVSGKVELPEFGCVLYF